MVFGICKRVLKNILKPLYYHVKSSIVNGYIEYVNSNLIIGYKSKIYKSTFGIYDTIYDGVLINNSHLGNFVYIASGTKISNCSIGSFCSIGSNVKIGLGIHPTNYISTFPAFFSIRNQCQISFTNKNHIDEIGSNTIGNDVWIGDNVIILSNIEISDGAIIAAGAVVTKNVSPYSIVGGVPAIEIRKRFSDEEINHLIEIKWWNKNIDWIKKNHHFFSDSKSFFKNIKFNE